MSLFIKTELRVEGKGHCSYRRSKEGKENVIIHIDGAKNGRKMSLFI